MNELLTALYAIERFSRTGLFVATCVAAVACAVSWATRTRRLSPFSQLGRFARERVDPKLRSIEGPVLNAGGSPTSVPWWGLAAFIVLGILAQQLLGYVIGILSTTASGFSAGPRGALRSLVYVTFAVLQLALMIRVLSSWFGALARMRWLRWTYTLTEPLLGPLRAILPAMGPFDLSPLLLFYLLRWVGGYIVSAI
jgi:YggT family protein